MKSVPRGKAIWNANGGFVSVLLTHLCCFSFVAPLLCFCCSLHNTPSITWSVYYRLGVFNILKLSRIFSFPCTKSGTVCPLRSAPRFHDSLSPRCSPTSLRASLKKSESRKIEMQSGQRPIAPRIRPLRSADVMDGSSCMTSDYWTVPQCPRSSRTTFITRSAGLYNPWIRCVGGLPNLRP